MNPAAKYPIGPFVELGRILQQELDEGRLDPVIRRATEAELLASPQEFGLLSPYGRYAAEYAAT